MEPKYPEDGHCQSVLRPQVFLTSPFILNNPVETAAIFNDVVSREINLFDLLRGFEPVTVGHTYLYYIYVYIGMYDQVI